MCAVSGLSETLWARTSDSQRVFTKVVRPVPEAPGRAVREMGRDRKKMDEPTTMRVNWTPFLTLFPLRLPAKDILVVKKRAKTRGNLSNPFLKLRRSCATVAHTSTMSIRRVPLVRPFHSFPRHSAITRKPFSELPKRPTAQRVLPDAANNATPPRPNESIAQGALIYRVIIPC